MECRNVRHMMNDYLAGALGAGDDLRMMHHLKKCRDCQDELEVQYLVSLIMDDSDTTAESLKAKAALDTMRRSRLKRYLLILVLGLFDICAVIFVAIVLIRIF